MVTKEVKDKYIKVYLDLCEKTLENNHFFKITTHTIVFNVNKIIDIRKLYNALDDETIHKQFWGNVNDFRYTKRNKLKKIFFNQISISYKDFSKKAIKIFPNGKIHITGLASLHDFENTCEMIITWLNTYLDNGFIIRDDSVNVVMTNGTFNICEPIKLRHLINMLSINDYVKNIRYNPEKYPAVNIKMKNGTSVFIFRTGKLIMSAKSIDDISITYRELKFPKSLEMSDNIVNVSWYGYDLKQFICCI